MAIRFILSLRSKPLQAPLAVLDRQRNGTAARHRKPAAPPKPLACGDSKPNSSRGKLLLRRRNPQAIFRTSCGCAGLLQVNILKRTGAKAMQHSIRLSFAALALSAFALLAAAPPAHADDHYKGCLFGTHDNYLLRTDTGDLYRLRDHSEDDIRAHLGEIVDVRGHIKDGEREREARAEAGG